MARTYLVGTDLKGYPLVFRYNGFLPKDTKSWEEWRRTVGDSIPLTVDLEKNGVEVTLNLKKLLMRDRIWVNFLLPESVNCNIFGICSTMNKKEVDFLIPLWG